MSKQLWSHQPGAIQYLAENHAAVIDAWMGTGKSYIAIQNIRKHAEYGQRRFLILCPSAVLGVWRGQFHTHAPGEFEVLVIDGSHNSAKKAEMISDAIRKNSATRPLVVVVNYETMIRKPVYDVLFRGKWTIVTCDELHKLKGHRTSTSLNAWRIGWGSSRRVGLTGTLMPHDPGDVFAQYRFLDDRIFGKYWTHFTKTYAQMNPNIPNKVAKWLNMEDMQEKVNRIRYHIPRSVLVLPDKHFIDIEVEMSLAGMKHYNEMRKHSITELKRMIEVNPGQTIEQIAEASAQNGAVAYMRMLQLAQGYVTADDKTEVSTDTAKRRMLLELLEESMGEKVCVYGWFHHDLAGVRQCCEILGLRYGEISGSRKDLTPHGKFPPEFDVMGVQAKSGSAGIDLTLSRIGIILNTGFISPGDYDQMIARQHRPGQDQQVTYYTLISKGTIEYAIRKARQENRDIVSAVLYDLIEGE